MPARLKALVTGGTGALGLDVAKVLLEAGYAIHVTASSEESARRFSGSRDGHGLTVHAADLSEPGEARRALRAVGGPLAALVCSVGGYSGGPFQRFPDEEVERLVAINLKSAFYTVREAYSYLKQSKGRGAVVLVAARGAVAGGPGAAVYSATKAAVVNLAKSLAEEWLDGGITVNAILPSTMDTPANRRDMPDADFSRWPSTRAVAEVVAFLVSEKARIVSGGAIPVYGKA